MYGKIFLVCILAILLTIVWCDYEERRRHFCEHSDPTKVEECHRNKGKHVVTTIAIACIAPIKSGLENIIERRKFVCNDATEEQRTHYKTCFRAGITAAKGNDPDLADVMKECIEVE